MVSVLGNVETFICFVKRLLNILRLCVKQMSRVNASDPFKHFLAGIKVQFLPRVCRSTHCAAPDKTGNGVTFNGRTEETKIN